MATIALSVSELKVGMLIYGHGPKDGVDRWSESDEKTKTGWRITSYSVRTLIGFIEHTVKRRAQENHVFNSTKLYRVEKPEPVFNGWGEDAL